MLVAQVKNVEVQCLVAEGELHDSIPAVDYDIRCGQKWPPKYDGHLGEKLSSFHTFPRARRKFAIISLITSARILSD